MKRLTNKEKYFISCFVEKRNRQLQPSLGKTISLYTFLDGTNESHEQQIIQIKLRDPLLSQILFDISYRVDDERFYKRKIKELQKHDYSESPYFINTFRLVSEWLWLIESDDVRMCVIKDYEKTVETNKQIEKIKELEHIASIRRENQSTTGKKIIAEKLLFAASAINKQKLKNTAIPPSDYRPSGSVVCFVCSGLGTITAERSCSKCMGRGFLRSK